jgi:hypothetical protein
MLIQKQEKKQMKKLIIVALAICFIASLAPAVSAEDRLSLSGGYRLRAWAKENYSDFNNANDADDQQYWRQRFRLDGAIQVAEGISAHFRFDIGEMTWGLNSQVKGTDPYTGSTKPLADTDSNFDLNYAYARWERDFWILSAGQQHSGFGNQITNDTTGQQLVLRLKLPVVVDFVYAKGSENGSTNDSGNNGDVDYYGIQGTYKADNWDLGLYASGTSDGSDDQNQQPIGIGLFGSYSYGMFAMMGEFTTFTGDAAKDPATGADIDARGTQIYADAKANVMPNLYFGIDAWWSDSQTGSGKQKVTGITDDGTFMPEDWGSGFNGGIAPINSLGGVTPNKNIPGQTGTNAKIPLMDIAGDGSGGLGFGLYGNWRFMEKWQLRAKYIWAQPSDTGKSYLDNVNIFNAGLIWDCLPNTTARVGYNYTGPQSEDKSVIDYDRAQAVIGMLQLTW